jgi:hypothetical protein
MMEIVLFATACNEEHAFMGGMPSPTRTFTNATNLERGMLISEYTPNIMLRMAEHSNRMAFFRDWRGTNDEKMFHRSGDKLCCSKLWRDAAHTAAGCFVLHRVEMPQCPEGLFSD